MLYVHNTEGRIRSALRNMEEAMDCMRAIGPGASIRYRDGTILARCEKEKWTWSEIRNRDFPGWQSGKPNPFCLPGAYKPNPNNKRAA